MPETPRRKDEKSKDLKGLELKNKDKDKFKDKGFKEDKGKDGKDVKDKNKEKKEKDKSKEKLDKNKKEKGKDGKTKKNKTGDVKKKMKTSARTRSAKAGLFFPVGRIHRQLKEEVPRHTRVGATAAIYIAAVMEYVIAEVLELAGNNARNNKKSRITPRNIQLAIKQDNELNRLITATISQGGVVPNIHKALEGRASAARKRMDTMDTSPLVRGRGSMTPRGRSPSRSRSRHR